MVKFSQKYRSAFTFMESHHHSAYLDGESVALSERLKEGYFTILRQGQVREMIKPGPPEMLFSVIFGILSETMKTYWNKGQNAPGEVISQINVIDPGIGLLLHEGN